jgi:hypothetical protein
VPSLVGRPSPTLLYEEPQITPSMTGVDMRRPSRRVPHAAHLQVEVFGPTHFDISCILRYDSFTFFLFYVSFLLFFFKIKLFFRNFYFSAQGL